MKHRKFNSIFPPYHHKWAAEALGMAVNSTKGPDLLDNDKIVELKFALVKPKGNTKNKNYPKAWTVLEYQMQYPEQWQRTGYWGLGFYELSKAVKSIDAIDMWDLETLVTSRELYIVPWNWMNQFPPHHTKGRTERSEWDHWLRYPKARLIPESTITYAVNKGFVYLTDNISTDEFQPGKKVDLVPF